MDVGERRTLGPDILKESEEKVRIIQRYFETAQNRQQSYANTKQRDLEF